MTTSLSIAGYVPQFHLGDRVRKAREYASLDQTHLGEIAGISRTTIARIEQGKNVPRRPTILAIAIATGVDREWLETGNTPADYHPGGGSVVRHQGLEPRTH